MKVNKMTKLCKVVAVALVSMMFAAPAAAQSYPSKAIRFVLPFPTGGPTDLLGRILAQKLSEQVAQPVVADNRPGAGGNLGAEYAAKQPPDGYTIVLGSPALAISANLYRKLNYDPIRDFSPITLVAQVPNIFIVHPSIPAKDLKELVAAARKTPGKLTFGSGGLGTGQHLAGEMFKSFSKLDTLHVPYKGSGLAMLAMMGGHVDMLVIGAPPAVPHVQSGKVRALAALAAERLAVLPNLPTSKESGFPGYEVTSWYGILAPANTPRDIITRLHAELNKAVAAPDTRERLAAGGFDPMSSTPERFADFIKSETARYAKVIKEAKLDLQQ
jgi:tripartite-type tricarboxylate transporter receptor subunit TctC